MPRWEDRQNAWLRTFVWVADRKSFGASHAERRYPLTNKERTSSERARRPGAFPAGTNGRSRRKPSCG
jgi:hypothetical protein